MIPTGSQKLGGYRFYWDPDTVTIPEKKRAVAVADTYGGSAIFEWPPILQGTRVRLEWDFMPKGMYKKLRTLYLQTGVTFIWNPQTGGNTYTVKIEKLEGAYMGTVHHEGAFRQNVTLVLNIRSLYTIPQSTSTTTTSTTTTT
jgi:hypothetical protein